MNYVRSLLFLPLLLGASFSHSVVEAKDVPRVWLAGESMHNGFRVHAKIAAFACVGMIAGWALASKISSILALIVGVYGMAATFVHAYCSYFFFQGWQRSKKVFNGNVASYSPSSIAFYSYLMKGKSSDNVLLHNIAAKFSDFMVDIVESVSAACQAITIDNDIPKSPFEIEPYLVPFNVAFYFTEK